jgi:hypothetical protein
MELGNSDGTNDGITEGSLLGIPEGTALGTVLGVLLGLSLGTKDGADDGENDGIVDGTELGCSEGCTDGPNDGDRVGSTVGDPDDVTFFAPAVAFGTSVTGQLADQDSITAVRLAAFAVTATIAFAAKGLAIVSVATAATPARAGIDEAA